MLLLGVKVLENASVISGPLAGSLLADLGAEVLKVEHPQGGDSFRSWEAESQVIKPTFACYNHGKKSIALDLKSPEGRDIFRSLAAESDVVLENYRPGVMDKLGLGWEALRAQNPRLVYCHITGAGLTGPEHSIPIFDAVAQAMSGLWSQLTDLDAPESVGPPMADQLTAIYSAMAICAALFKVRGDGTGTKIDVNMLAAAMAFQTMEVALKLNTGESPTKTSRARRSQSYAFVGSDHRPFAIHLSTPAKFWRGLCATVDIDGLETDERFATKPMRIAHYDDLEKVLQDVFRTQPRDFWLGRLREEGVPAAPILTVGEAMDHPQINASTTIVRTGGEGEEPSGYVAPPILVDGVPTVRREPAPALGAHTAEVLASLGIGDAEQAALRASGTAI
jgi:crotonobetainyl-CoA:carnitine CoA-transferase CaiB-like acyl-CoA transferase